MLGTFQTALRDPDTALIISGFGFNDDHIAKPVMAAIEANMSIRVIVCDPAFLDDASLANDDHVVPLNAGMRIQDNLHLDTLKKLVTIGDQRIVVLNGRFEDLAFAIPDLVAQTERERHLDRMQKMRDLGPGGS
jgi:hypothetical protein